MFDHINDERFIFVMAALSEAYGQETNPFKEKIYAKALDDIPIEQIEAAAWEIIRTRTLSSFPKASEIREYLGGGKAEDKAILALDTLEKAMSSVGQYRSVVFSDPVIMAAVYSMGGWVKLCSMEAEEWKWARKDFEKIYRAFISQDKAKLQIPEHLAGFAEATNSARGLNVAPEIAYVGESKVPLLGTAGGQ